MTRYLRAGIVAILFVGGVNFEARAQGFHDAAEMYELVLRDGSRMYGTVEKQTGGEIVLRTTAGVVVTARRDQILRLKLVSGRVVRGEFQRSDPNTTRLFFAPTGRALTRGQAYLGVHELLLPSFQIGVTDRISVGGGTPLLFFGEDEWERPFWVTPKVQLFDTGRLQGAAGVFHGFDMDGDGGGIAYGVATAGSPMGSLTTGAGIAYANDGGRSFIVMIGGDRQIARSVKVITENYVWKGGNGVVSVGFRFFGEQLSADLGLMVPIGADETLAFPVVNFVYMF
jgi:hypothetical protein